MKDTIIEKYNDLCDDIRTSYNKIKVIDNYDFYRSCPYTIFYLNKNESFEKFKDFWGNIVQSCRDSDCDYDDILWKMEEESKNKFDYIELGTLDIYTDSEYELEI